MFGGGFAFFENARTCIRMALMKKELFICDRCGMRKRLPSAARHWCDNCNYNGHLEMRPAREKKLVIAARAKEPAD
jgi:hypothetical protein